jgi:integrase
MTAVAKIEWTGIPMDVPTWEQLNRKLTVHTLRKCCGQNWADYLPMNVVKELMGHSNISTTQEFYTTVDRDHEKKAAQVVQQLLDKNKNDIKVTCEVEIGRIGGKQ